MNREQAIAFVTAQAKAIGVGFHPDDSFADYVCGGQPSFDAVAAADLDSKLAAAHEALGDDIYLLAMEALRLFPFGQVLATPAALAAVGEEGVADALHLHGLMDQGALGKEDHKANAEALKCGGRIFSAFAIGGTKLWVITEGDRASTTVLLPEDY